MLDLELTPEQQEEAERIADILKAKATVEIEYIAKLLASRKDHELFGKTEFLIRDAVHRLGAHGLDAALQERKKRDTRVPRPSAPTATKTSASTATDPAR
jgi:hypothetical protein